MSALEIIISAGGTLLLGLLVFNTSRLYTAVDNLTSEVSGLKADKTAQQQLNEFTREALSESKQEVRTLRRAFAAIDKIIYARLGVDVKTEISDDV